jgi:hypothetical protein
MADCPAFLCKKTLEELKAEAFAQLERRGYEVRGKTTTEIRQIIKRRPTKLGPTLSQITSSEKSSPISRELKA